MIAFFSFFLILILIIILVVLSLVGSIVGGILNFLGIGSNKRRNFSNRNAAGEDLKQHSYQSQEGVKRMRKFKNAAEDTDYEIIDN